VSLGRFLNPDRHFGKRSGTTAANVTGMVIELPAMRTGSDKTAGFTLLEAMLATIILALSLSTVLAVSAHSMRHMNDVRLRARSQEVLQRKMEDLRLLTWSQVQSLTNTFTDPTDTQGRFVGTITTNSYDSYNGTTTVMRVTLTVTWTNRVSRVVTNAMTTLISNSGLNNYVM